MIKCPQMAHFSEVCWKPEYWKMTLETIEMHKLENDVGNQ
jgi:hypothetical protein